MVNPSRLAGFWDATIGHRISKTLPVSTGRFRHTMAGQGKAPSGEGMVLWRWQDGPLISPEALHLTVSIAWHCDPDPDPLCQ